jgi:hypothetical protein
VIFALFRRRGAKAAAFIYAGYKWFEDHTDDVERWSDKAIIQARGKRVAKVVIPAANSAKSAAQWVRQRQKPQSKSKLRRR